MFFSLIDIYRGLTTCSIGDGSVVLFWKDFWVGNELLADKFPRMYSYVDQQDVSVQAFLNSEHSSTFSLPLSEQAYEEFQLLQLLCEETQSTPEEIDVRTFVWGKSTYAAADLADFCRYMF